MLRLKWPLNVKVGRLLEEADKCRTFFSRTSDCVMPVWKLTSFYKLSSALYLNGGSTSDTPPQCRNCLGLSSLARHPSMKIVVFISPIGSFWRMSLRLTVILPQKLGGVLLMSGNCLRIVLPFDPLLHHQGHFDVSHRQEDGRKEQVEQEGQQYGPT